MRILAAGLIALIVLLSISMQPSSAQNTTRPYCIRDGSLGRGMWDCSYYTLQQCQASASGAGGTCWENPNYKGPKKKGASKPQQGWGGY